MISCCGQRDNKPEFITEGVKCPYMATEKERVAFETKVRNICIPDHPDRKQLQKDLATIFKNSDVNNDEEIQREEFDTLVEYTAEEPRRCGFVPTLTQMFSGNLTKVKEHRDALFEAMKGGEDKLNYEKYEEWTLTHIRGKVENMRFKNEAKVQQEAADFVHKLKKAKQTGEWDKALREYKDMFERSGEIIDEAAGNFGIKKENWGILVEMFAETPRLMGLVPQMKDTYKSSDEMKTQRDKLFEKITGGKDYMTYKTFKDWLVVHLKEKLAKH